MHSRNKSLNFGLYVPNDQVLNKKVPGNPKYQHVKPAVYTGHTVRRQIDDLRDKQKNCQYKKDEVFNRIKFSNFIELIVEAAKVKLKSNVHAVCSAINGIHDAKNAKKSEKIIPNVIMGIGEIDLVNQKKKPSEVVKNIEKDFPYLLLDVRDKEKFLECHIKTAKHYPSALLARSIGYEIESMKIYKNSSLEVIIIYDDDESIAVRVATTLVQRGYDNIFLLTGGLKYCNEVFPRKPMSHLCTHNMPEPDNALPVVQEKNALSELNQEDIEIIEQYMEYPRNGHCTQNTRCGSSHSRSEKGSVNKYGDTPSLKPKTASLTYRRGSDGSITSIEQTRTKLNGSAAESKSKTNKKAPWK